MSREAYEKRSRKIADITRRTLVALNTGGIAMAFAVAGTLAGRGVEPRWAVAPVAFFVAGLVVTALSLFLAKHKALKRRDANGPVDRFKKWWWANFTYEILALIAFIIAVALGLWELSIVTLPGHAVTS